MSTLSAAFATFGTNVGWPRNTLHLLGRALARAVLALATAFGGKYY
jgi:hypothetical protein